MLGQSIQAHLLADEVQGVFLEADGLGRGME